MKAVYLTFRNAVPGWVYVHAEKKVLKIKVGESLYTRHWSPFLAFKTLATRFLPTCTPSKPSHSLLPGEGVWKTLFGKNEQIQKEIYKDSGAQSLPWSLRWNSGLVGPIPHRVSITQLWKESLGSPSSIVRCNVFSCFWFFVTLWRVASQAPLSLEFSRQDYWSGLPFPPSVDLPDPGMEPGSPVSPASQAGSIPLKHQGSSSR